MPTIAELAVDVEANAERFKTGMASVRSEATRTREHLQGLGSSFGIFGQVGHELHETLGHVRSELNPLLELAGGFAIGRGAFEALHEMPMHFAEGFAGAQAAGEGFFQSIADGTARVIGLGTAFEKAAERMQKLHEKQQQLIELNDTINKAKEHAETTSLREEGKPPNYRYPFARDPAAAESTYNELHDTFMKAAAAAKPFTDQIYALNQELARAGEKYAPGSTMMGLEQFSYEARRRKIDPGGLVSAEESAANALRDFDGRMEQDAKDFHDRQEHLRFHPEDATVGGFLNALAGGNDIVGAAGGGLRHLFAQGNLFAMGGDRSLHEGFSDFANGVEEQRRDIEQQMKNQMRHPLGGAGPAVDAYSAAGYAQIQESRDALSQLGDDSKSQQLDELKEQNDTLKAVVDVLQSINTNTGAKAAIGILQSIF